MVYVYDLEQLANLHTATFVSLDKSETHQFVIHHTRDDRKSYMDFLRQSGLKLIGYNNINYDYQILHRFILSRNLPIFIDGSSKQLSEYLYGISQEVIRDGVSPVPEWDFFIPQRDLFKIHHFDNKARRTSLKHLQVVMKWPNVQDMPYKHDDLIHHPSEVEDVLEYNLNDVLSTLEFYNRSQKEIAMRRDVGRAFDIYVMNANDPKIGQEIILKEVAKKKGVRPRDLRDMRTNRKVIHLKDIILPYVKFSTPAFQKVLEAFKNRSIVPENMKGAFDYSVLFDGMKYDFGVGGLHACRESDKWLRNPRSTIESVDVTSYYPNLAVQNRFHPKHLGEDFCDVYSEIFYKRKEYPKGTPQNYGLKIALNGVFGKSNDFYSPLYDPKLTVQITVNGQLLLAMLCEELTVYGFKVIMANTDGIEVVVEKEKFDKFMEICKDWQDMTNLELEGTSYKKLFIRDVNNYIGEFSNGEYYVKGAYEIDKAWNKNPSQRIVPIAVRDFLLDGVPVMDTLRNWTDITDFMLSVRMRSQAKFKLKTIEDGMGIEETELQKTNRYVVVTGGIGGYLFKEFADGRVSKVNAGYKVYICNNMDPWDIDPEVLRQHIDYRYYYHEAMKLITPIMNKQTSLF